MRSIAIINEFWSLPRVREKWRLTPIVMFLLLFGVILVTAKGSALVPSIRSLF